MFNIKDRIIIRIIDLIRIDNVFLYKFFKSRIRLFIKIIIIKNFKKFKFDSIFRIFY